MASDDAPAEDTVGRTRCGFVAILGAPNTGKSTLLNRLVGVKVSIVTHKVQTTRSQIRGIAIAGRSQLVFIDTPGIFAPKRRLERAMVDAAWSGAHDADMVVVLVDSLRGVDQDSERIIRGLEAADRTAILALNKIDTVKRERLLGLAEELSGRGVFEEVFMISALTGDGVDDLAGYLAGRAPEGPWHYPEDQLSDLPQRLVAAEITREKAFLRLHEELPYELAVDTDRWQAFEDGSVRIDQTIYVARESQKGIVLGKKGRAIRSIREQAQAELAELLGCPVHLFVHVKVRERWIDDPARYRDWGLRYDA
ncbi:MAG: GTPase Era [Alphaproteobacteria bacterium]